MAGLPALTSLDVSGCRNLSNGGLRDLAASRPGLRHLRLAWCREITSSGLLGLSPLTELRSLALDEVKQVMTPFIHWPRPLRTWHPAADADPR